MATSNNDISRDYMFLRNPTDLLLVLLTAVAGLVYNLLESQRDMPGPAAIGRTVLLVLTGILVVRAATSLVVDVLWAPSLGRQRSSLVRLAVALLLYCVLALLILRFHFGFDLSALLVPTAVATAVIVLATKPTLGNLMEGIALRLGKPFRIGDYLQVSSHVGRVENITWRSVALRKRDGSLQILPNSKVAEEDLDVYPAGTPIRHEITFSAPITVPPQEVKSAARRVMASVPNVDPDRASMTRVAGFHYAEGGDDSDRVQYAAEFYCEDYELRFETAGIILERLWYAFARHETDAREAAENEAPNRLGIISAVDVFARCSEDARLRLATGAKRILYSPGETMRRASSADCLFVVASGMIEVRGPTRSVIRELGCVEVDVALGDGDVGRCRLQRQVLSRCTAELAQVIGPFAKVAVAKAARMTANEHRFYEILAEEIPSEEERNAFLRRAPRAPALVLSAGALFGNMSRLTGESPREACIVTLSAAEVLEIRGSSIADALSGDTGLAPELRQSLRGRTECHLAF